MVRCTVFGCFRKKDDDRRGGWSAWWGFANAILNAVRLWIEWRK
jgi:hypothetical protein